MDPRRLALLAAAVFVAWAVAAAATLATAREGFRGPEACFGGLEADVNPDVLPADLRRAVAGECAPLRAGTPLRFESERLTNVERRDDTVLAVHAERMYACLTVPPGSFPASEATRIRGPADLIGWTVYCGDAHAASLLKRVLAAHDADASAYDVRVWTRRPESSRPFALFAVCAPSSAFAANSHGVESLHVIAPACDRAKLAALVPFATVTQSELPGPHRGTLTLTMDLLVYGRVSADDAPSAVRWIDANVATRAAQKAAYEGTFPLDGTDPRRARAGRPPSRAPAPITVTPAGPVALRSVATTTTGFRSALLDQTALPGVAVLQRGDRLVLRHQTDPDDRGDWYVNDAREGVLDVANAVVLHLPRQDVREVEERGIVSDIDAEDVRVEIGHAVLASAAHPFEVREGLPVRIREIDFYGTIESLAPDRPKAALRGKSDEDARERNDVTGLLFRCFGSPGVPDADCPDDRWDRPCVTNSECPFYLANRNYANTRGGCVAGHCEMPLGVSNLTYRNPRPDDRPLCYNCPGADAGMDCCEEQRDKRLFHSPDYAFAGDAEARRNALGPSGPDARMQWHSLGGRSPP